VALATGSLFGACDIVPFLDDFSLLVRPDADRVFFFPRSFFSFLASVTHAEGV